MDFDAHADDEVTYYVNAVHELLVGFAPYNWAAQWATFYGNDSRHVQSVRHQRPAQYQGDGDGI